MLVEWNHQRPILFLFCKSKKRRHKSKSAPLGFIFALMMISYIIRSMYFIGKTLFRGRKNWSECWNQSLEKILYYIMPAKEPLDPIISRNVNDHKRKRLLILGLITASSKYTSVLNIDISEERMLEMKLSKSRGKDGKLKI